LNKVYKSLIHLSLIVLILFVVLPLNGQTQGEDSLKYERLVKFPLLSVRYFNYSNSDFDTPNGVGQIHMGEFNTNFQFAIPLKEKKAYLINRLNFTKFDFDAKVENVTTVPKTFYSLGYTLGVMNVLSNNWKILATVTPTLASDFEEKLSAEDLIIQSAVIATKRSGPYFEYGFGAAYSTRFGREMYIPLASMTYKKGRWGLFMLLPAYVSQYYHFNNSRIGLTLSTFGNVYNYSNEVSDQYDLDKMGYTRINIGPEYRTKLFGDVHLGLSTGVTVRNKLESINGNGGLELDLSTQQKFFFKIEFSILK